MRIEQQCKELGAKAEGEVSAKVLREEEGGSLACLKRRQESRVLKCGRGGGEYKIKSGR